MNTSNLIITATAGIIAIALFVLVIQFLSKKINFEEDGKVKTDKFALGARNELCQNRDGIAIIEVAKRVRKQTNLATLMFVLADGQPCANSYSGEAAIRHTRQCVLDAQKMNMQLIQVCIEDGYDPKKMFDHFVKLKNMNTLAPELGKLIKKSVMKLSHIQYN